MADQKIYIDSNASTGGDGSIETPYDAFSDINWTTSGANSIFDWVAAGDDVFINLKSDSVFAERFEFETSGATGHRIALQDYGTGALPIIEGVITVYAQLSADPGIDHISVTNIKFTETPKDFTVNFLGCDDVVVTGCEFEDSRSLKWLGNTASFYNNKFTRNRDGSANSVIEIVEGSNVGVEDLLSIYNNYFIDCYTTGVAESDGHMIGLAGGTASSRAIKHAEVYDNVATGCGLKSGKAAISIYNAEDVKVFRNKLINGYQGGINIGPNCSTIEATYNVITGNMINGDVTASTGGVTISQSTGGPVSTVIEDIVIAQNTIYDNNDITVTPTGVRSGIYVFAANISGYTLDNVQIKNNIVQNNFTSVTDSYELDVNFSVNPTITNLALDYNNYYRTINTDNFIYYNEVYPVAEFGDYQTEKSQDANSIASDPLLLPDVKIYVGSPANEAADEIAGINDGGELDPYGNATTLPANIGAYQGTGISPVFYSNGAVKLFVEGSSVFMRP